jgi:peptidoglycan lytic transglycosylase F
MLKHLTSGVLSGTACLTLALISLGGCTETADNKLQAVKDAGELVVLTRNSPTTYYEVVDGYAGLEYDMVQAFAKELGVKARFILVDDEPLLIHKLARKEADFAAAGIARTPPLKARFRFTPSYQTVTPQLIYRSGGHYPKTIAGLKDRNIEVPAKSRYNDQLKALKVIYPYLQWTEVKDVDIEDLLQQVWEGLLEHTIVDSHIFGMNKPYYPELRVALNMHAPQKLAWAFPPGEDNSLYYAASGFIKKFRRSGKLTRLISRYYGNASRSNPVNMTVFHLRVQNRLPSYQTLFEEAGENYNIDWRLLAAMGYQESFWNPRAISPTGVRGIMMLTRNTAKQIGVTNRLDPSQAIDGGARYFAGILTRLPKSIVEPDRVWFALASYNVGYGHVEDARKITQGQKADPDNWEDVRKRLPLLSRELWYKNTKHGYARGQEPVRYVTRIRNYYEALVKIDEAEKQEEESEAIKLKAPAI